LFFLGCCCERVTERIESTNTLPCRPFAPPSFNLWVGVWVMLWVGFLLLLTLRSLQFEQVGLSAGTSEWASGCVGCGQHRDRATESHIFVHSLCCRTFAICGSMFLLCCRTLRHVLFTACYSASHDLFIISPISLPPCHSLISCLFVFPFLLRAVHTARGSRLS
jgi:hypothetical protein